MAERVTRSRVQGPVVPTYVDPCAAMLRLFSDARQDAVTVLQGSGDGPRKLPEACAKVRLASTQLLEMVQEELEQLEDRLGEGGGLSKSTTPRLPHAQAGKAVSFLVDACHLTMRAVLHQSAQQDVPTATKQHGEDSNPQEPAPAAVPRTSAALGPQAQLWRCGINVATALQDASRLLAAPVFYNAYTAADPSCDSLLSIGELGAAVMRQASAASATLTAAAREQRKQGQGQGAPLKSERLQAQASGASAREVAMAEALVVPQEASGAPAGAGTGGMGSAAAAAPGPPDVSCLLASHGYSLLLVACEQQPESLLDAMLGQPGGSQRLHLLASAALELAAARIMETAFCGASTAAAGVSAGKRGGASGDTLHLPQQEPVGAAAAGSDGHKPSPAGPAGADHGCGPLSFQFRQLQLVAMRFSELLADDGGYKLMAKQTLLPAMAEALLSEPRRFVAWWGCGQDAVYAGLSDRHLITAPQLADVAAAAPAAAATIAARSASTPDPDTTGHPGPAAMLQPPPSCPSTHEDKLQTAAVGMLLKSPAARNCILPLLRACVQLPGAGTGLAAFGDCFQGERFIYGGEGTEREELYVGGRGRGYKRRKILNPDAHGVDTDNVSTVAAAMTSALECSVLLCKTLSNASVGAPPAAVAAKLMAAPLSGAALQQQLLAAAAANAAGKGGFGAVVEGDDEAGRSAGRTLQQQQRSSSRPSSLSPGPADRATGKSHRPPKPGSRVRPPGADAPEAEDPLIGPPQSGALLLALQGRQGSVGSPGGLAAPGMAEGVASPMDADGGVAGVPKCIKREQFELSLQQQQPKAEEQPPEQEMHMLPLASAFWQLLEARSIVECGGAMAEGPAAVKREAGGAGGDGGGEVSDPRAAAAFGQLSHMARNLAMLLSLLQPVCPNGGQDVRDAVRQMGFPILRWPRMNVRLPVLVVEQDCELLLGLLEDLSHTAGEFHRRRQQERQQHDAEVRRLQERDDRRRKRQQAEGEQQQRDGRDDGEDGADEVRGLGTAAMQTAAAARGVWPGAPPGGPAGVALQPTSSREVLDVGPDGEGGSAHQPRVRLVLRRGGGGGDAPTPGGRPGGSPGEGGGSGGPGRRKGAHLAEDDGDEKEAASEDYDPDEDDDEDEDVVGAAVGGRRSQQGAGAARLGVNGEPPREGEDAALLLGLQVPRQRRSNRPVRPRTPTPPPEAYGHRERPGAGAAGGAVGLPQGHGTALPAAAALPPPALTPSGRRTSGSGGVAAGGPSGARRHPAAVQSYGPGGGGPPRTLPEEDDDWIGPVHPGAAAGGGDGPASLPRHVHQQQDRGLGLSAPMVADRQQYSDGDGDALPPPKRPRSAVGPSAPLPPKPLPPSLPGGPTGARAVRAPMPLQSPGQQQHISQHGLMPPPRQVQPQTQQHLHQHQHVQQQQLHQHQQHVQQQMQQQQQRMESPSGNHPLLPSGGPAYLPMHAVQRSPVAAGPHSATKVAASPNGRLYAVAPLDAWNMRQGLAAQDDMGGDFGGGGLAGAHMQGLPHHQHQQQQAAAAAGFRGGISPSQQRVHPDDLYEMQQQQHHHHQQQHHHHQHY